MPEWLKRLNEVVNVKRMRRELVFLHAIILLAPPSLWASDIYRKNLFHVIVGSFWFFGLILFAVLGGATLGALVSHPVPTLLSFLVVYVCTAISLEKLKFLVDWKHVLSFVVAYLTVGVSWVIWQKIFDPNFVLIGKMTL